MSSKNKIRIAQRYDRVNQWIRAIYTPDPNTVPKYPKIIFAAILILTLSGLNIQRAPVIGVQIENTKASLPWLVKPSWVRMWLRWYEIELEPGIYTWGASQDEPISDLKKTRSPLLLTITTTPEWARIYPDKRCSPPRPEYLDDFTDFVNAAIERYQPQAVELINEPEVPHDQIGEVLDYWIGCWGPHGFYYAEMLKTLYPVIKKAHPDVLVVAGSLMLDDAQKEFWPEVLETGGRGNYDVLSFHAYTYYPVNDFDIVNRKAKYLRDIGETSPLWLTETSLLCSQQTPCTTAFEADQADYFHYIFDHSQENDIDLIFWFTLAVNEWQNSDLVNNGKPRPSWFIYRDIATFLIRKTD